MIVREIITDTILAYMKGLPEPKELPNDIRIEIHFSKAVEKHNITFSIGEGEKKCENVTSQVARLVEMYNEICGDRLPKVRLVTERRKRSLGIRLRERTLDEFKELFSLAAQSDFLCGKNDRSWTANFDWLINESNMVKVLEGNFTNKTCQKTTHAGTATARSFDVDESLRRAMERSYGGKQK